MSATNISFNDTKENVLSSMMPGTVNYKFQKDEKEESKQEVTQ